jgi:hypothetical protein
MPASLSVLRCSIFEQRFVDLRCLTITVWVVLLSSADRHLADRGADHFHNIVTARTTMASSRFNGFAAFDLAHGKHRFPQTGRFFRRPPESVNTRVQRRGKSSQGN